MDTDRFGPRTKALLALRGRTARWLASGLGTTPMQLSNWTTGTRNPGDVTVNQVRALLGWTAAVDDDLERIEQNMGIIGGE